MATKYVYATIQLTIQVDDGVSLDEALHDMDYAFKSQTPGAEVIDTEWMESDKRDAHGREEP